MENQKFELTEQHLGLLKEANVRWDESEYGAPAIDSKRPYGNSGVLEDLAEILGVPWDGDEDNGGLSDSTVERLKRLHMETETALQICLATQSFKPGMYEAPPYGAKWKLV